MLIREHTHSTAVKGSLNEKSFLIVFSIQDFYVKHEKMTLIQIKYPLFFIAFRSSFILSNRRVKESMMQTSNMRQIKILLQSSSLLLQQFSLLLTGLLSFMSDIKEKKLQFCHHLLTLIHRWKVNQLQGKAKSSLI